MMEHQDRRNAASGLRTTQLTADALVQQGGQDGPALSMPYAEICEIRLNVEMAGPSSQVVCRVSDRAGHELAFSSMSWVRPGAYELKADTFRALLIDLHRALDPWRSEIRFVEGPKLGFMIALFTVGTLTASICLAGFAWLFFWQENGAGLFFLPGVIAGAWLIRLFWPRPPKPYDPDRYALAKPLQPSGEASSTEG
ncbi:hypothetical protein [uncultured Maricaulis sp.]|uniref:hypothetical protein n=1 Tax=uncultured Maricaulis sp. TaxID=174710 RepID=UPI0030DA809D